MLPFVYAESVVIEYGYIGYSKAGHARENRASLVTTLPVYANMKTAFVYIELSNRGADLIWSSIALI